MKLTLGICFLLLFLASVAMFVTATQFVHQVLGTIVLNAAFVCLAGAAICERIDGLKQAIAFAAGSSARPISGQ